MYWALGLIAFSCPLILAVGWVAMQFRLAKMERAMKEVLDESDTLDEEKKDGAYAEVELLANGA